MTAVGLIVAAYQTYRVKRITRRNREQMLMFLSRANYVSSEHQLVDEINKRLDDRILQRYVSAGHQAGCDLYLFLVEYYLSLEDKFTIDDLRRISNSPLITTKWQEQHWRALIALRPENRDKNFPTELFTTEDRASRYLYHQYHKDAKTPNTALEPTAAAPSVLDTPSNPKSDGISTSASGGGGSALDR